jgi:FkbH-like protein
MNLAVLSNINLNSIIRTLKKKYNVYEASGYGLWVNEILDKSSELYQKFNAENIFIILDGEQIITDIENYENTIDEYINCIELSLKYNSNVKFFVSNIDLNFKKISHLKRNNVNYDIEYYWQKKINKLNDLYDNMHIFDMKNILKIHGIKKVYSSKMWYLSSNKFSIQGEKLIIEEIDKIIKSQVQPTPKCILLDLDNTLWGGILGEDGISGIELDEYKEGARYKDFQKRLKDLKEMGVILGIVSKNNYNDVTEAFSHKHMFLKEEDFVIIKANWNPKSENIKLISKELNIGLSSIVFIDDNPVEREEVKAMIPEVIVPKFPNDTSELEQFSLEIYNNYFYSINYSEEDKNKTIMYKQNFERANFKNAFNSLDDYYEGLDIKIKIDKAKVEDIKRISQMTQKTNQFNFTTKRYTESDIYKYINSEKYKVYVITSEDKFGNNGQSALIILKLLNEFEVEIDTFLLSCRIMGRTIEFNIINYIEDELKSLGYKQIYATYIPTNKNIPVKDLFEKMNYQLENVLSNGIKNYSFKLINRREKLKSYARLK